MNKKNYIYFQFLPIQLILAICACVWIPALSIWHYDYIKYFQIELIISLIASSLLVFSTLVTLHIIRRFPGIIAVVHILPIFLFWFTVFIAIIKIAGLPYSLIYYSISGAFLLIFLFLMEIVNRQFEINTFAYIPVGRASKISEQVPSVKWIKLDTPILSDSVTGIVTDLHSDELKGAWEYFIAEQTLSGVPVYHHRNIRESLTGRVRIKHLYENELGSLLPSKNYMIIKVLIESCLVLLSLPLTIPVMLVAALLIKLESPGKVLFTQKRVGQGGKEFVIYKFRSMCEDSEAQGAKMARTNDMRVTRVGRFIRKTRIDELPQFFNILKGDMALIGPRPEQKIFVEQFEKTIPFYNYRHIVKPGITGWAQVTQGYAGNEDETKIKVEHDFFYIKHFSFSLDLLIFFKTIHTMLTGFGAR